jgi:hypothetical protein
MRFHALLLAALSTFAGSGVADADVIADFEDIPLAPGSFDNGNPGGLAPGDEVSNTFVSEGAEFNNVFGIDPDFQFPYWAGWSISNIVDTSTPGFGNQYASFAGGGSGGAGNYGIAFGAGPTDSIINLPEVDFTPIAMSAEITNTTYTALSMRDGDAFSSPFGGDDGNRPDFFLLTITGYAGLDATGATIGSIDFYLADYRSSDNSLDYILDAWTAVDLGSLLGSASLGFTLTADPAHNDPVLGMTAPAYFALDNLTIRAIPEPSTRVLLVLGTAVAGLARLRRARPWRAS